MAIDMTSPRSRRALLTAAVSGAAAAVVANVAKVAPVTAADGAEMLIGRTNEASSGTSLTSSGAGLTVETRAAHDAISAFASNGIALGGSTDSTDGIALATTGRVRFREVSGVATIRKGRKTVTVKPVEGVHGKPFVLLTPRSNIGSRGLWYSVQPFKDSFTIRMSSKRGAAKKVGWLILEWD